MVARPRQSAAAVAVCGAMLLSGCTTTDASPTPALTTAATPSPTPTPSATATPAAVVEPPASDNISCDTMLDPAVDARLRAEPLVPYPKEYQRSSFGFVPTGAAISCPWGPPDGLGGPADAYYTWAELLPGDGEIFLALAAEQSGYTTEPAEMGVWVLPNQEGGGPIGDYLVTDKWVAYAQTRDQITDIVWTRTTD